MANTFQITVPDIGNFDSVEVIDVMVKVGDTIKKEDSLITVESDKASMDIPSTHEGKVTSIDLKVGDKVKQGSNILVIELNESNAKPQKAETQNEIKPEVKADIKKESEAELDRLAKIMQSNPDIQVMIEGHTDNLGGTDNNLVLSQARANAVALYLIQNHGIDASRLKPVGLGETTPLYPNDSFENRAKNRRVVFKILRKGMATN